MVTMMAARAFDGQQRQVTSSVFSLRSGALRAPGPVRVQRAAGRLESELLHPAGERSPVLDIIGSGGGSPLDAVTQSDMEARFGHDFSDVRVHTSHAAHESARSVNASAYTVGSNIVFQRNQYDPSSSSGRLALAHELTHVVQQRSGPVDGSDVGGGIRVSDPSDRFEREAVATASQLMSGPAPQPASQAGEAGRCAAAAVQRESDEAGLEETETN
ncbi:MAG: DUF4157 domain-containing protein [Micromonosporaceae bacterium]|nr:DUF4157 domain-containing protein [Micromonosporaceae bacterium]